MVRIVALAALAALALAPSAGAIEMQTNFHYGENVGFPPMEVPTTVYGGWGTPGWNCNNIGRVPVQPGLPAMYPTGCNPGGGGCNYCDSAWSGYQQKAFHKRVNTRWYYGNHRGIPAGFGGPAYDAGSVPYDVGSETIENETSSVIQPQQGTIKTAPTPAAPIQVKPTSNDRPVPRTTNRTNQGVSSRRIKTG